MKPLREVSASHSLTRQGSGPAIQTDVIEARDGQSARLGLAVEKFAFWESKGVACVGKIGGHGSQSIIEKYLNSDVSASLRPSLLRGIQRPPHSPFHRISMYSLGSVIHFLVMGVHLFSLAIRQISFSADAPNPENASTLDQYSRSVVLSTTPF